MRTNSVKASLKQGQPQIGTWLSLASPLAARYMARTGFDWLTLDIEHSPVDWEAAAMIFGAIADAGGIPLARVPFTSLENVKRCLDAGAFGIIFPMCNSVEEAELAVGSCNYPPVGRRSVGGGEGGAVLRHRGPGLSPEPLIPWPAHRCPTIPADTPPHFRCIP